MIDKALYDYLTDPAELTGHPADPFLSPQKIGNVTLTNRNDARRGVRSRLGQHIYTGRVPHGVTAPTTCTLRVIPMDRFLTTVGAHSQARAVVQVDVYARGPDAAMRAAMTSNLIRIATMAYHGDYWGDIWIAGCNVERDGQFIDTPFDSKHWTQRYSQDLIVQFAEATACY